MFITIGMMAGQSYCVRVSDSSLTGHERCTASMIGSMMVLSVYMPHGGFDEEEYITEIALVKIIMDDRNKMGPKISSFAAISTLSSHWKGEGGEEYHGLDSLYWYGLSGPECQIGREDVVTYEKTSLFASIERLQLLGDKYVGEL